MKKILFFLLLMLAGVGTGGGAAYGVAHFMGPPPARQAHELPEEEPVNTAFVPAGTILAPIIAEDGGLSGYANFDVQLEVPKDKADEVAARLPLLLHAVNLRAWKTPMASGPHHMLPELATFAKMVEAAANDSLGKGEVIRAVVTAARPV